MQTMLDMIITLNTNFKQIYSISKIVITTDWMRK